MAALAGGAKGPGGKSLTPCRRHSRGKFYEGGKKEETGGVENRRRGEKKREEGREKSEELSLKGNFVPVHRLCIHHPRRETVFTWVSKCILPEPPGAGQVMRKR